MSLLSKELDNLNNPALGAALIWSFTSGYEAGSEVRAGTPFPLIFIVLPMMFQPDILAILNSTNRPSGLRKFIGKFSESSNSLNDTVFSIQDRTMEMRSLSLDSLRLAIAAKLVSLDVSKGEIFPLSLTPRTAELSNEINEFIKQAEKLGYMCSKVTLKEISIILKLGF